VEFSTAGDTKAEILGFDYGHTDKHHTHKKHMESGLVSGNGYGLYSEHLNASLEAAGGPKGPQQAILLASLPATIAIVAATGGTPATTGPPLMIFAAVVAALCCTFEEVKEISALPPKEEKLEASA